MAGQFRFPKSPRALLVFEAAARTGSFTSASAEFNVSQPSISRTVSQLEQDLGLRLFVRHSRGLDLTSEGAELLRAVSEGFLQISRTLETLEQRKGRMKHQVTLSVTTSYATQWLIPRLAEFNSAFPTVDLQLKLLARSVREVNGEFDIALRLRQDDDGRFYRWHLAPEIVFPVCSPGYLIAHGPLAAADAVADHTFLHMMDHSVDQWRPFLACPETDLLQSGVWNYFSDYGVTLQAATQGKGVALGWISVAVGALNSGALVPASDVQIVTKRGFDLVVPKNKPVARHTFEICEWLTSRMVEDITVFEEANALTPIADPAPN